MKLRGVGDTMASAGGWGASVVTSSARESGELYDLEKDMGADYFGTGYRECAERA